jgi:hypothetical protein
MKLILGMILSSFVATVAFAGTATVAQQSGPTQALPEQPPTPGSSVESHKDPHATNQSSGAIIRKHDTSMDLQPAKKKKAKKVEDQDRGPKIPKKPIPVTPNPGESVD